MSGPGEQEAGTPRLVNALADLWQAIQARHPGVPDVAIVLGSGTTGRRKTTKLGHFAARRWVKTAHTAQAGTVELDSDEGQEHVHELLIGGEGLVRGADAVLEVVLHEAAHALAEARGIADTSMRGTYHNQRFRALAAELGLDVAETERRGWSHTSVPDTTAALYSAQVQALADAISMHRVPEASSLPGSPRTGRMLVATCGCQPVRRVRVARGTFDLGEITCSVCGEAFTLGD